VSLRTIAVGIVLLLPNGIAYSQKYSDFYVFGDSLSDTGNMHSQWRFPPSPPYYQGRNSNGPIWLDLVAEELELPVPRPSRLGGNNFAYSGAQTGLGNANHMPIPVPNVGEQIKAFQRRDGALSENTLVSLVAGANDIFVETPAETSIARLKGHLQDLHALGGRHFLIANVLSAPSLDMGPFNQLFTAEMTEFSLPDSEIMIVDVEGLAGTVRANPDLFGVLYFDEPACGDCGTGGNPDPRDIDPNPDEYSHWDNVHPSGRMNELWGKQALKVITGDFPGDFSLDGTVNVEDLDGLVTEMVRGTNDTFFDLSGDGVVDTADLTTWLAEAAVLNGFDEPYQLGDANLDGKVDSGDLNSLALDWRLSGGTWSGGDFTADGIVNAPDLNALALNWRESISATGVAVPEPSALVPLFVAGAMILAARPRSKSFAPRKRM
jgi:thermolabile hemolysin